MFAILAKHNIAFPINVPLLGRPIFIMDGLITKFWPEMNVDDVFGATFRRCVAGRTVLAIPKAMDRASREVAMIASQLAFCLIERAEAW